MFTLLAVAFQLITYCSAQNLTSSNPSATNNGVSSATSASPPFSTNVPLIVQGEAIVAHFTNAGLIPSLFKNFTPLAVMSVSYNGVGTIAPGQNLTVDQVKEEPSIMIAPLNSSISLGSQSYTLAMVDAGAVGDNQANGQVRHWLSNGITISGSSLDFANATNITDYVGPNPPEGEGAHRYVFALFVQPKTFTPTGDLAAPDQPLGPMDVSQYVNGSGLGSLIAGMYLETQRGVSTVTLSPTSPVVTSTLPGFAVSSNQVSLVPAATQRKKNSSLKLTYNMVFSLLMTSAIQVAVNVV